MERIKIKYEYPNHKSFDPDQSSSKWSPLIENKLHPNVRNPHFLKLFSVICEVYSLNDTTPISPPSRVNTPTTGTQTGTAGGFGGPDNELVLLFNKINKLIQENPFYMEGKEVCNLLTTKPDWLLENGKLLSEYTNSIECGVEIFRHYIDADNYVIGIFPEMIPVIRQESIEYICSNE